MVTIFSPPGHPIWLGWAWWKPSKDWTVGCPENPPVMVECRTFKNHVYFFVSWGGALQILRSNHQQTNIFIWTSKLSEKKYWFGRLSHLLFLNIWVWLKMRGAGREVCSLPQGVCFAKVELPSLTWRWSPPKNICNPICLYTTDLEEFHSTHLCISILRCIWILQVSEIWDPSPTKTDRETEIWHPNGGYIVNYSPCWMSPALRFFYTPHAHMLHVWNIYTYIYHTFNTPDAPWDWKICLYIFTINSWLM